jgi:hypothetical protein
VFYLDVTKVYRDVAHVAMATNIYCKCMFHLFFRCRLQMRLFGCYIFFTHILQVFYLDVAYVLQCLFMCFQVFLQVF